jgi:hypothetical protein
MFIDFLYYSTVYGGKLFTAENFDKYSKLACLDIEKTTLCRVNEKSIVVFSEPLRTNIKFCACVLAELFLKIDEAENSQAELSKNGGGIVKNRSAGAVSVTYDTSASYASFEANEKRRKIAYATYLFPQCGLNLLSRVVHCV